MHKLYILLASALLIATSTDAQNWTVGQPVSLKISSLTLGSFQCYPQARANVNYPVSNVLGIEHAFIVTAVQPAGGVEIGAGNIVAVNDTVWFSGATQVFFNQNSGSVSFDVYAIGTPTMPGQAHPCAFNDLWMSNLLLCFEGLNGIMPTNCVTQTSTSISENADDQIQILYPNPVNGDLLNVRSRTNMSLVAVYDLKGSLVNEENARNNATIDLSFAPSGLYILNVTMESGSILSEKFILE